MRTTHRISRLASVALVAMLLTGCSPAPSPRPATLDEAIKTAVDGLGLGSTEPLFRGDCDDRTCVVVGKTDDPQRIALIVLEPDAPYTVEASTSGRVDVEPTTLDEMGTGDHEFVYGRIEDPAISRLEVDLLDGERLSFDVAPPGYAAAYPEERGPVQAWRFLSAGGRVIRDQKAG